VRRVFSDFCNRYFTEKESHWKMVYSLQAVNENVNCELNV
jgi:hypothetical protein